MPGTVHSHLGMNPLSGSRKAVEEIIGAVVTDDIWGRFEDAMSNFATVTPESIGFEEWKGLNRKLKKRLRNSTDLSAVSPKELRALQYARAFGDIGMSDFKAVSKLQSELLADEKLYRERRKEGISDQPPFPEYHWIEYAYSQTAAVCAYADIFDDAGLGAKLTDTRDRSKHPEGVEEPTSFERFCFVFLFGVSVSEVCDATRDTAFGEGSFKHFQRIREALKHRRKLR